ncbi:MAG: hypothetical protein KGI47_10680 [Betaproteobacteria bacterium]|nr:hypothetical protein [Betaproteobacteria bacterium]
MQEKKNCFVIAPIGEPDSETRKRSDQVLKHVIRPAVTCCGYHAIRADEIDKPGIITSQVIQHIVNDPLVVADLTEKNPNVFYELALRHALRKPLVQIIRKGDAIPFDVAGTRTIYVDHKDLDSVESAKNEIIEQIKALERDSSDIETPISVSLDLQLLRQSEKPEERSLADLVASMVELRASLSKLELKIGTKEQQGVLDEIQDELRSLPGRLDEYFEGGRFLGMRRGRFHPIMLRELMQGTPRSSPALGVLIVASMFRDSMPWLYELGMELYRMAKSGNHADIQQAAEEFRHAAEFAFHGPLGREFFGRSKEMFIFMEEIDPLLDRALKLLLDEPRRSPRKIKVDLGADKDA